jgi:D-glycero-alpha-D-manno-heptose-7-phosphate kinase
VQVAPLSLSTATLHDLEEHLLMFFTGYSREAGALLADQKQRSDSGDEAMLASLDHVKELGREIRDSLRRGEAARFGQLMHEHWLRKRERSEGMSNEQVDHWYEVAMANGALGGKLVGAGGGGFLLFYAAEPKPLRAAMKREGLPEVRFSFDFDGSTVVARD